MYGRHGESKRFFKIWTKRNSTVRKLHYTSLTGTTSDVYGAKEEKESSVPSDSFNFTLSQWERVLEGCNPRVEQKAKKSPQQGQKIR